MPVFGMCICQATTICQTPLELCEGTASSCKPPDMGPGNFYSLEDEHAMAFGEGCGID